MDTIFSSNFLHTKARKPQQTNFATKQRKSPKNTNFTTKQFKMQQNTINCTQIEGDFRFLHTSHVKKFEINPHVEKF